MTVLLTTHYLDEADRLANRLAIVDHGRVVVEGTPEELKSELRGDVLQVELEGERRRRAGGRACSVPRPGSPRCCATGASSGRGPTRAPASYPPSSPPWPSGGLAVVSATVARPSLDDVYLRHAGRSFEAEVVAS